MINGRDIFVDKLRNASISTRALRGLSDQLIPEWVIKFARIHSRHRLPFMTKLVPSIIKGYIRNARIATNLGD